MSDADLDFLRKLSERQRAGRSAGGGRGRRRNKRGRGRRLAPLVAVGFLLAVVGGVGYLGFSALRGFLTPPDYGGQGTGSVTVQIHDGDSVSQMAARLYEANVVRSAKAFVREAREDAKATSIQPGFYRLRRKMSAKAALGLLLDPAARAGRLTIPEGKRVSDVLQVLSRRTRIPLKDFQQAARNPKALGLPSYAEGNLEGFLYPFTYDPNPKATAAEVLAEMVARFKEVAARLDLVNEARRVHMSPHDLVTVASLVQAESGTADDMPKVSRVIYNRLRSPEPWMHKLQLDSTVMYGLGKYGIVASTRDLRSTSPYNTYNRAGLPPGAISNPGEVALRAALHPVSGPWLYFVATDPAHHVTKFTASHDEFVKFRQELARNTKHG
jgi:UPF0755 protein